MQIGRIQGATRNFGAPREWDKDTNGPCCGLPVRDEVMGTAAAMTSAWLPTEEEIERIKAGAPVYLTVLGVLHPPVAMAVGPVPE